MRDVISKYNIKIMGDGAKTIVFGHGLACNQNTWQFLTPYFQDQYKIILFDYIGSGNSDKSFYNIEKYSTLDGYIEDLKEILKELDIVDAIFIGHSISSMIGMQAAINMPNRIKSIVMIGPSPRYLNEEPDYYGGFSESDVVELIDLMEINFNDWAEASSKLFINAPEKPELSEKMSESIKASQPMVIRQFALATFFSDSRAALSELKQPVLIIQCSEDSIVPIEVARYLENNLANSTLVVTNIKGHYPHMSYPEETYKIIKEYLTEQGVGCHD